MEPFTVAFNVSVNSTMVDTGIEDIYADNYSLACGKLKEQLLKKHKGLGNLVIELDRVIIPTYSNDYSNEPTSS